MPKQSLQQARQELENTPLGPEVRRQRARELDAIVRKEVKERRASLNDRLTKAKDGYKAANDAQSELEDAFDDLARREGRLSAEEYHRELKALHDRQAQLEQSRARHRTDLLSVGEAIDALEDDPDAVIDNFYDRYSALERPTRHLSW
jgi:plasmid stabilization system protein ParE